MSRVVRDSSWHLFAFVIVVAGLSILAPLTWWHAGRNGRPSHSPWKNHDTDRHDTLTLGRPDKVLIPKLPLSELQVAPIGPLIADQINLDPSVNETPALPTGRAEPSDDPLQTEATGELRLSATLVRPSQPFVPQPNEIEPLRQPADAPGGSPFAIPESAFPPSRAWPHPTALLDQLHGAALATPLAAPWAEQAIEAVSRLIAAPSLADPAVSMELANLRSLADEAKGLAQSIADDQARSKILRAGYALVRRLVIWDTVYTLAASGDLSAAPIVDHRAWTAALSKVDSLLHTTGGAAAWRKYLLIDRAKADFDSSTCSPVEQRQLARDMLHRLHSTQLSREQEKFLHTPPFEALDEQLQAKAAATPDLAALLRAMERHEHEDSSLAGRALATEFDLLRWSPDAGVRELAEAINAYYRNANVRVALSSELVNRMIPQQTPQVEAVEDNILGAWVSGQSQTNTKVNVALVPDQQRWNIGLEATGEVATDTSSSKGPATFYQRGWSMFRARKRLTVDRRGVRTFSAEAEASANTDLNDLETEFDGIPLLGGLIRAIARD
ncbi:MAG TPA: hypothetical protein VKH44_13600, partial [Pirellulaceae bacterium]|nr:hypothetical protein [Pirellulaceae bacterium]